MWFPDDGPRTETCRSVFNVLMCKIHKFYICAVIGVIIEQLNNMYGVTTKKKTRNTFLNLYYHDICRSFCCFPVTK